MVLQGTWALGLLYGLIGTVLRFTLWVHGLDLHSYKDVSRSISQVIHNGECSSSFLLSLHFVMGCPDICVKYKYSNISSPFLKPAAGHWLSVMEGEKNFMVAIYSFKYGFIQYWRMVCCLPHFFRSKWQTPLLKLYIVICSDCSFCSEKGNPYSHL